MKRFAFIIITSVLIVCSVSVPAFASDSDGSFDFIDIFVPADDYFQNKITDLNDAVNKKLGGIGYLYQTINTFFKTLNSAPAVTNININLKNNFTGGTQSISLFEKAAPFVSIFRGAVTCFLILSTCVVCYKKLIVLFEK